MSKLYWIEEGDYSDYRVVGVYDSKEKAEKVAEYLNRGRSIYRDGASVVEVPLNPAYEELNSNLTQYLVNMTYDGNAYRVEERSSSREVDAALNVWTKTKASRWETSENVADEIKGDVWAKDKKHAVKIANEFKTRAIAEGRMNFRGDVSKAPQGISR